MIVLDTSAILAVVFMENGRERVAEVFDQAVIGAVNLAEVITKLTESRFDQASIDGLANRLRQQVIPLSEHHAVGAGLLRAQTRHLGLSLGDRCCLSLARDLNATVLTADRAWVGLDVGVTIEVIR